MNGLFIDTSATVVFGLSPWILPLIAIAAKLKDKETHAADRRRFLPPWLCARAGSVREDRARDRPEEPTGQCGDDDKGRRSVCR